MKRVLGILLMAVYSFSVLGSHVHVHYCMNKYAGWSILHNPSDGECDRCGMKNTKCCKTEVKENKATSEQAVKTQIHNAFQPFVTAHVRPNLISSWSGNHKRPIQFVNLHAPPLLQQFDRFSNYCIFRI